MQLNSTVTTKLITSNKILKTKLSRTRKPIFRARAVPQILEYNKKQRRKTNDTERSSATVPPIPVSASTSPQLKYQHRKKKNSDNIESDQYQP